MDFSLAYLKSPQQILIRHFSKTKELKKSTILNIEEIGQLEVQGLIGNLSSFQQEEIPTTIATHEIAFSNYDGALEEFDQLGFEKAESLFTRSYQNWVLNNNLSLLEALFPYIKHLKALWPNDRVAFFEELWNLLRKNLGTKSLKIVYNSVQKAKSENEKDGLIQVMTHGVRTPQTEDALEVGKALMKKYDYQVNGHFEVIERNEENGQVLALATINQSPVIIMGELYQLNKLQLSLLNALFDGLQS